MVSNGSRRPTTNIRAPSFLEQAGEQFSFIYAKIYNSLRPKSHLISKKVGNQVTNRAKVMESPLIIGGEKLEQSDSRLESTPLRSFNRNTDSAFITANTPEARKIKELESKIDWLVGQQTTKFGGIGDEGLLFASLLDKSHQIAPVDAPSSRTNNLESDQSQFTTKECRRVPKGDNIRIGTQDNSRPLLQNPRYMNALMAEMKHHKLRKVDKRKQNYKVQHGRTESHSNSLTRALHERFALMEKENKWQSAPTAKKRKGKFSTRELHMLVRVRYKRQIIFARVQENDTLSKLIEVVATMMGVKDHHNFKLVQSQGINFIPIDTKAIKDIARLEDDYLYLQIGDEIVSIDEFEALE